MPKISVRQVEGEERDNIFHWLHHYAFRPTLPFPDKQETAKMLAERKGVIYLALFEDDKPIACIASTPLIQNVRGKITEAGGVYDVITHPNARRKGYSYRLLTDLFGEIKQAGAPFTCLYPFRESFYERAGYVSFQQPLIAKFQAGVLTPLLEVDIHGNVELMLIGEGYQIYRDYLVKVQKHLHGAAVFKYPDPGMKTSDRSWLVVAKVAREVVGVMIYTLSGRGPIGFDLIARRFFYTTVQGRYLLLNWIAKHTDQVGEVQLWLPPHEHPNTWFPDMAVKIEPAWLPGMGRVLDVGEIGGMQVGPGKFSAQISDSMCPWNENVWTFESKDGILQVRNGEKVDCHLNIQGLSALVYGTTEAASFGYRGWGNPGLKVQAVMREMFPRMNSFLLEMF